MEVALVSGLGFTFAREQALGVAGDFDESFLMQLEPSKAKGLATATRGFKRRAEAVTPQATGGGRCAGKERKRACLRPFEPLALSDALQQLALPPALLDFVKEVFHSDDNTTGVPEAGDNDDSNIEYEDSDEDTGFERHSDDADGSDSDDEDDDEDGHLFRYEYALHGNDDECDATSDSDDNAGDNNGPGGAGIVEQVYIHIVDEDDLIRAYALARSAHGCASNAEQGFEDDHSDAEKADGRGDPCDASDAGCSCSSASLHSLTASDLEVPDSFDASAQASCAL